ncbi:MAG: hemerythrin family protein [Motiliproteus sp.]
MPIIWKEEMSIGHEVIDNEHKYLFCLVNSVELALKLEDSHKLVAMFIDQLQEYTLKHFLHEEGLQLECNYPHYAEHKNEHQKILSNLATLKFKLNNPTADKAPKQKQPVVASLEQDNSNVETGFSETACHIEDYDPYAAEPSSDPVDEIVKLLRSWILDHVLVTDMILKKHMQKK